MLQNPGAQEYVTSELNLREVETCADLLKYCSLRAEPQWGLLGKKLGRSMGAVAKAVKELSVDDILGFEKAGSLQVAGHTLEAGEIKVGRFGHSSLPGWLCLGGLLPKGLCRIHLGFGAGMPVVICQSCCPARIQGSSGTLLCLDGFQVASTSSSTGSLTPFPLDSAAVRWSATSGFPPA